MFGVLLVSAVSDRSFFVRVLLANLYYLGGVNNIMMWSYNAALVHMKLTNVVGQWLPRWLSNIMFLKAVLMQLMASVIFMIGFETTLMAKVMLAFVVPVTFIVHDMWTIEHEHPAHKAKHGKNVVSRDIAIFPTEFDNEFVHFFKNSGMIGGLALFVLLPGPHQTSGDLFGDVFQGLM